MKKFYQEYKITQWKFWQNFWEYYKVFIFYGLLIVILAVIGIRSCATKVEKDFTLTYYGEHPILTPDKLEEQIGKWVKDMDGDGKVTIEISNNPYASSETAQDTTTILNKIDAELISGDPFILMVDDANIHIFVNKCALQPLDGILEGIKIPERYVIRDKETSEIVAVDITEMPIAKEVGISSGTKMFIGMKVLPKSEENDKEYMKRHNQVASVIRNMVEYKEDTVPAS